MEGFRQRQGRWLLRAHVGDPWTCRKPPREVVDELAELFGAADPVRLVGRKIPERWDELVTHPQAGGLANLHRWGLTVSTLAGEVTRVVSKPSETEIGGRGSVMAEPGLGPAPLLGAHS